MARPHRVDLAGAWHHVMNRGAGQQPIFESRSDRLLFLDLLVDAIAVSGAEIHAYCLMGNHYHLLVHTPEPALIVTMQRLGSRYTRQFNGRHGRDGPLFRGRFGSELIETDRQLLITSRYIHRNPVEAGLVTVPERYPWSSYPAYVGRAPRPHWLHVEPTLELVSRGLDAYRALVETRLPGGV